MSELTDDWLPIIERAAKIIGITHRNSGVVMAALNWQALKIQELQAELEKFRATKTEDEDSWDHRAAIIRFSWEIFTRAMIDVAKPQNPLTSQRIFAKIMGCEVKDIQTTIRAASVKQIKQWIKDVTKLTDGEIEECRNAGRRGKYDVFNLRILRA